jgi:hypothetical protein
VAALRETERVAAVVVDGESGLLPTVLPAPHSYTAPEPALPPEAVNVAAVVTPLHILETLDAKPVGAVGGVLTEIVPTAADEGTQPLLFFTVTLYVVEPTAALETV